MQSDVTPAAPERRYKISSHTLTLDVAERLRSFAFEHRFSESCIVEHVLQQAFERNRSGELESELRAAGCTLRRAGTTADSRRIGLRLREQKT